MVPSTTAGVSTDSATWGTSPGAEPVTRTASRRATSAGCTTYDGDCAPLIGAPSRNHWYCSATSPGTQVPGAAVRGLPTFAVPFTLGGVGFSIAEWGEWTGAEDAETTVVGR